MNWSKRIGILDIIEELGEKGIYTEYDEGNDVLKIHPENFYKLAKEQLSSPSNDKMAWRINGVFYKDLKLQISSKIPMCLE